MIRRVLLTALMGLVLSACATSAPAVPQRFSGTWTFQFETSAFQLDNGGDRYWLSGEGAVWNEIIAPINGSGRGPWGREHLVVEGYLSPPGQYGHLGAYTRELRVTRVIEAILVSADGPPSGS